MNLMRQGGVLWLLRHEVRLSGRRMLAGGKAGGRGRIVRWAILGALLLFASGAIAFAVSRFAPAPPTGETAVIVTAGVMALVGSLMVSQAIWAVVEVIYVRNDLDLLLASPIKPWTILLVRTGAVALQTALFYLIVSAAFALWMVLFGAPGWLVLPPAVFILSLTATAIALLLVIALFRAIGPRNTRVVAQIAGALIGAGFFLGAQANNFAGRGARREWFAHIVSWAKARNFDTAGLAWFPARAMLGDPLALVLWAGFGVGMFMLAAWLFSRGFVEDAAAAAGVSRGRKRAREGVRALRGGLTAAIVRKEFRLLRRDPLLLSQIGLQLVYFLPLIFLVWRNPGGGESSMLVHLTVAAALVSLSGFMTGGLAWITASAEDAPDLIAAAPVTREQVDRGKLIAAVAPVLALLIGPLIAVAIDSPLNAFWIALFATGSCICAGLIGIWYQKPGAKRSDFRRRRGTGSILASIGQSFITLGWGGGAALAVSGLAWFTIVPVLIAIGLMFAMSESRPKPE